MSCTRTQNGASSLHFRQLYNVANYVVLMPDGVGVRNFLLSGCLARLSRENRVIALHSMSENAVDLYVRPLAPQVEWQPLYEYNESSAAYVVRNALGFAHMYWADTQALRFVRRRPVQGSWRVRAATAAARAAGYVASSRTGVDGLEQCNAAVVERSACAKQYQRLLADVDASILFCTNQRPSMTAPAVYAARHLGIPTATFIFSWDNLTSKSRMAAPFDHHLVWGEQMRRELLQIYPHVNTDRVHVTGTPQFDCHTNPALLLSREDFCRIVGADPDRPFICYSGGDAGTCPEDQDHVRILLDLVRQGKVYGNPQVLLRPTPVDSGKRYDRVRAEYPELIYCQPEWHRPDGMAWSAAVPLQLDLQILANLTRHADVNVNLASTMTLDFAIHDRPVVNVAFDVNDPPLRGIPVWDYYYQFEHYRPVTELKAVRVARSPDELAEHVSAYLRDPALDREGRRKLVDLQIGVTAGRSADAILSVLGGIAKKDAALLSVQ